MAQPIKALADKHQDLSLIPRIPVVGGRGTNSYKMSSEYACMLQPNVHTPTH